MGRPTFEADYSTRVRQRGAGRGFSSSLAPGPLTASHSAADQSRGSTCSSPVHTGAVGDFMSWSFVLAHGLDKSMGPSQRRVKYADGSVKPARGELTLPLRMLTRGAAYECKIKVIVAELQPSFDIVLRTPFCRAHRPQLDWDNMTIELPERRARDNATVWSKALRAKALISEGDSANTVAMCELSTPAFERLWERGGLDMETVSCVNIRSPHRLNAIANDRDTPEGRWRRRSCRSCASNSSSSSPPCSPTSCPRSHGHARSRPAPSHKIELKDGAQPYSRRCAACPHRNSTS